MRRGRWPIAVSVLLIAIVLAAAQPAAARATPFRRVAPSITSFASDGERYVAWQVTDGSPITVLDTQTGRQREIASGCGGLSSQAPPRRGEAAAGRFLIGCPGAAGLLDVRSGTVKLLPTGLVGPEWVAAGRYYLEGNAPKSACHQSAAERRMEEPCLALYDIATGAVSVRPQSQAANLDRPGAPLVCPALRPRVIADAAPDSGVYSDYSDNRFSEPSDPLRIYHCHGPPTVIRHPGNAGDLSVRGTLVSWDDGLAILPLADEENPYQKGLTHATLSTYTLANGHRRSFALPALGVPIGERPLIGVFGYSAHTSYAVFWIAVRTLAPGEAGSSVATYAVYTAKL